MSNFLRINLGDIGRGLIVAFFSGFLTTMYGILQNTSPTLEDIRVGLLAGLAGMIGYLIKNYFTNNVGQFGQADKFSFRNRE